jgi:hypothetical protein
MPLIKAYRNADFLTSPQARSLRIQAEYLEPEDRFKREGIKDIVAFFGSARTRCRADAENILQAARQRQVPAAELTRLEIQLEMSRYYEEARELARLLTLWARETDDESQSFALCSGGGPGIMEATNRGAHEAGGRSIGLNISLPREQESNPYITEALNLEFHYFFMRKLWFVQLACAIVVFPGGFGTLDELAEVLTLIQTRRSQPMPVVLYGTQFWDEVLNLEALERWGMISREDLDLLYRANAPQDAFDYLQEHLKLRST